MYYLSVSPFIHLLDHLLILPCCGLLHYYPCYNPIFSLLHSRVGCQKLGCLWHASILGRGHFFNVWHFQIFQNHFVFPGPSNQQFLQGARVPIINEWHLETKDLGTVALVATGLSLLWGSLTAQNCIIHMFGNYPTYIFLLYFSLTPLFSLYLSDTIALTLIHLYLISSLVSLAVSTLAPIIHNPLTDVLNSSAHVVSE